MSNLFSFKIYRTEELELGGKLFTVQFCERTDGEAYELFARSHDGKKNWRTSFSSEVAADFSRLNAGQRLQDTVYEVLKSSIEGGLS